jgi:hypothetical protein
VNNKPLSPAVQPMLDDMDRQTLRTLEKLMPKPSPQAEVWGKAAMQLMQRGAAKRRAREGKQKLVEGQTINVQC